ncbi:MAG: hypothetical protein A2X81_13820 [Desulfobacterales bacterium GWB2_56_26]|nr:MAG: hypothetical protein A2X81_13820 [Desulfobacterales bacterium GWB2_56_26]
MGGGGGEGVGSILPGQAQGAADMAVFVLGLRAGIEKQGRFILKQLFCLVERDRQVLAVIIGNARRHRPIANKG